MGLSITDKNVKSYSLIFGQAVGTNWNENVLFFFCCFFLSLQRSDPCFDVDFCENVSYTVDPFSFALHFLAPHINWNPIGTLPSTPGKMQSGECRPMIKFAT